MIRNPILRGFHPDPCIVRDGEDYYIANSSFEWFPGVPIHHSRDLVNWRLAGYALTRQSQIDLRGAQNSGGVWAPALIKGKDCFYLVYSNVRQWRAGSNIDVDNFLITAKHPLGPWSDPVYLNSSGFDPSLFEDDDGSLWILNMKWDHRPGENSFAGIAMQRYNPRAGRLEGDANIIFKGSELSVTEGPHIFKRNGWYYLVTAEGGTHWNHAVTLARSTSLQGPYEIHPRNPVLSSSRNPNLPLQKCGHGNFVETPEGKWYLVHLCSRPQGRFRRCTLGRETAIQSIRWRKDGWPELKHGGCEPALEAKPPRPVSGASAKDFNDDFRSQDLDLAWNSLRENVSNEWVRTDRNKGGLIMKGRKSLRSRFEQSLLARRVQDHDFEAETILDFSPQDFQQMAGLTLYYNTDCHYYACLGADEGGELAIVVSGCDNGETKEFARQAISKDFRKSLHLRVRVRALQAQFAFRTAGQDWAEIGPKLDASILSDDYPTEKGGNLFFTGMFVGLAAQDFSGNRLEARFQRFAYRPSGSAIPESTAPNA